MAVRPSPATWRPAPRGRRRQQGPASPLTVYRSDQRDGLYMFHSRRECRRKRGRSHGIQSDPSGAAHAGQRRIFQCRGADAGISRVGVWLQNFVPFSILASPGSLPTTIGNVRLTLIDSTQLQLPMGLSSVSPTQINFVVPENASLGPATVKLSAQSVVSTAFTTVQAVQPGLFTSSSDGIGTASANVLHVNADGTSFSTTTAQCS